MNTSLFSLSFKVDELSLFFLLLISAVSIYVFMYTIKYRHEYKGRPFILPLMLVFVLSMLLVVVSSDIITFLIFWELMSLSSFLLVISEGRKELMKAGVLYFIITHIGTAFITASFYLLSIKTSSFGFYAYGHAADWLILFLAIVGFSAKAGVIPIHVWLPHAHPVAPSNVSALMSGVMVKVPIYGILRFLYDFGKMDSGWTGILILAVGSISAIGGVMYALGQHDLKRLLAYSTIENVGIILMGVGISCWALTKGYAALSSLALLVAMLHILNHALFKSALFMGAGLVHKYTHTRNMEDLGGLAKRMPITSALFLVATMAISALPPLNGFVSEWYLYMSLIGVSFTKDIYASYVAMGSIALLSLTGALACACFVKVYGITFLGRARSDHAEKANEAHPIETISLAIPVILCIIIGVYPSPWISMLNPLIVSMTGEAVNPHPFAGISLVGKADYSAVMPFLIAAAFAVLSVVLYFALKAVSRGGVRYYETWACGLDEENPRTQLSAGAFSYAIRRVFSMFYSTVSEINFEEDVKKYFRRKIFYKEKISDPIENFLYVPVKDFMVRLSERFASVIETDDINRCLGYIFLALLLSLMALGVLAW